MDNIVGGSGGSYDPGMEGRLQRLEDMMPRIEGLLRSLDERVRGLDERVERLDAGQRKVELDVAEMKGRMSQLPSMWAMLTAMLGGQVAFAAVMATIWVMAGIH